MLTFTRSATILAIAALPFAAQSQSGDSGVDAPYVSAPGRRLPATFLGALPCADCTGIAHHLDLWPDSVQHLRRDWRGAPQAATQAEIGRWSADPVTGTLTLCAGGAQNMGLDLEDDDLLRMRPPSEGAPRPPLVVDRVAGTWSDRKCDQNRATADLVNSCWRIVSLKGQPVAAAPDRRQAHIVLRSGEVPGYPATVGRNRFAGGYFAADGGLRFDAAATARMACMPLAADHEARVAEGLAETQSQRRAGEAMALYDKDGAIVAVLQAVYLR